MGTCIFCFSRFILLINIWCNFDDLSSLYLYYQLPIVSLYHSLLVLIIYFPKYFHLCFQTSPTLQLKVSTIVIFVLLLIAFYKLFRVFCIISLCSFAYCLFCFRRDVCNYYNFASPYFAMCSTLINSHFPFPYSTCNITFILDFIIILTTSFFYIFCPSFIYHTSSIYYN